MTVSLIATDLDGTLLRSDGSASPRTSTALRAAQALGWRVVVVTARPPRFVTNLGDTLACEGTVICSNGALIYDIASRRLTAEHAIEPEAGREIVARLRAALPDMAFAIEAGLDYGYEPAYRPRWPVPADALVADAESLVARPVAKLIARDETAPDHWQLLARVRELVGDLVVVTTSGIEAPIEISAPGISKAFALRTLAEDLGLPADRTVAFGDMPNDIPMLEWSGHAVAVANAHPEVLAIADEVTASNDEDGVALVVERYLTTAVRSTFAPNS